jgi:dTDP-4-dehydrorhamnose reductase
MKILLLGKNGQVGWELQRSLAPLGELIALDRHSAELCGDLSNLAGIAATVQAVRPDVIVNAAAYTAVDQAEGEAALARTLNTLAPGVLAIEAEKIGALLVHYSTDYVFDGSGNEPWCETDAPGPLNVYGQTKLEGEQRIQAHCPHHLIFRTSWVYAARGTNFAKIMLRLAQEHDSLTVIDDQFGAPTGAELLADITAHAIRQVLQRPQDAGLYHLAAQGVASWWSFANHLLEHAGRLWVAINKEAISLSPFKSLHAAPTPTRAYPTPARRPLNTRLNTKKLQTTFGLTLPAWQNGVERMLFETLERRNY